MKSFGLTDKGKGRADNQDSYVLELVPGKNDLIAVLCDGMGGAKAGGLASQMSIRSFVSRVYEALRDGNDKTVDFRRLLLDACREANSGTYEFSRFSEDYKGMGTTLVGGVIRANGSAYFLNVGDSRAYLLSPRKGGIRQITRDHSLVAELMRFGAITPEEAKAHPQRNVITRALGTEPTVDADFYELKLKARELLLLCSDGLSNMLTDEEILAEAKAHPDPEILCRRLVELTLQRGARDNVTVLAVRK